MFYRIKALPEKVVLLLSGDTCRIITLIKIENKLISNFRQK